MDFDKEIFYNFCTRISIPSKEGGLVRLRPNIPQRYIVEEIVEGLGRGIHHFTILKCGQAGCTTICLAFDLYWIFRYPGLICTFIADDDEKREVFNLLVRQFIHSLQPSPEFCIPTISCNSKAIGLENSSIMRFLHANRRVKGMLGRGVGTPVVHGTECAFWDDEEGWKSLLDRLANKNPNRLFLFESTANGHNFYKKKWEIAKRSSAEKAIFVGWWLHEDYQIPPGHESHAYEVYWETSPKLTREEAAWVTIVQRHYGVKITPAHMAWWRFKLEETYQGDVEQMYQENPPYDSLAFQFSGTTFISKKALNWRIAECASPPRTPRYFRFHFGNAFMETRLEEFYEYNSFVDLIIWEEPNFGQGIIYSIGADPAHGASASGCNAAVEVVRCYADKVEQVAEFVRNELPPYRLAWVILYLYGAYSNEAMYGVEVQGGGIEVFQEIDRIRRELNAEECPPDVLRHFATLRTYMYSRWDGATKTFNSKHFKTTEGVRDTLMDVVRTYTEKPVSIIHSEGLVQELQGLRRKEGGKIESAEATDRVMAYGFALLIYVDHLIYKLARTRYRYDYPEFVRDRDRDENEKYTMSDLVTDQILHWKSKYRNMRGGVTREI